jgi:hypothetical protein
VLSKIVLDLLRHDHLGGERDRLPVRLTEIPEQVTRIGRTFASGSANGLGSLHQGTIGKLAKKLDRVKNVGLAGTIRPRDASERTEINGDVAEVLKPMHLKPRKHSLSLHSRLGTRLVT